MKNKGISRTMAIAVVVIVIVVVAGAALGYVYLMPPAKKEITVLTAAPLIRYVNFYKDAAEKELGITINTVEVPYGEMWEKVSTDVSTGAGKFDIWLGATDYVGSLVSNNYIIQLDDYFAKKDPALDDVLPWIRNRVMKWGGHYYAMITDGDCHTIFYRKDLWADATNKDNFKAKFGYDLPDPPKTIHQLIDCANFFNGWDWNNDGKIEYGIGLSAKRGAQSAWTAEDFAAQYAFVPGAPSKYTGVLYFDPETMEPLVKTPGWVQGFKDFAEIVKYGPPVIKDFDVSDVRARFMAGELAIGLDWTDSGPLSIAADSKVKGKVQWAPVPGADKYYDLQAGEWVDKYNRVALLNFGGWGWFILSTCHDKDLAYDYVWFMTRPERGKEMAVAHGETGVNLYRKSSGYDVDPDYWLKQGWDAESAADYSRVVNEIYNSPNVAWDIRVPGFDKFWDTLDYALNSVATGAATPDQACAKLYDDWNSIINELGKDMLLKAYRADLGLTS